jgi:hypothetical protein
MILSTRQEAIEFFKSATLNIHCMERFLETSEHFKGKLQPFKSATLQISFNEMRYARMFAGDCLRLLILDKDARERNVRFIPANHGAVCDNESLAVFVKELSIKKVDKTESDILGKEPTELELELAQINEFKAFMRNLYYDYLDAHYSAFAAELHNEFNGYKQNMETSLKKSDMNLGLRLNELYAEIAKNESLKIAI